MKKILKIMFMTVVFVVFSKVYAADLPESITVATSGGTFTYPGEVLSNTYQPYGNLYYVSGLRATTYKTAKVNGKTVDLYCIDHDRTNPPVGATMKKKASYDNYPGLIKIIEQSNTTYSGFNIYESYYIRQMATYWYIDKKNGVADNKNGQCSSGYKTQTSNKYVKASLAYVNSALSYDATKKGGAAAITFNTDEMTFTLDKSRNAYISDEITVEMNSDNTSFGLYPSIGTIIDRTYTNDRKTIKFKLSVPESSVTGNSKTVSVRVDYAGVKSGSDKVFYYVVPNSSSYQRVLLSIPTTGTISKTISGTIGKYKCPYTPETNLTKSCYVSTSGYVKDIEDWDCIFASADSGINYFLDKDVDYTANPYCDVFCRETVEYHFPSSDFTVRGGSLFTLGTRYDNIYALVPLTVTNEKECRDKGIKNELFVSDYNEANNEMTDYWTKYKTELKEVPVYNDVQSGIKNVAWNITTSVNSCGDTYVCKGCGKSVSKDKDGKETTTYYDTIECSYNRTVTYISKSRSLTSSYIGQDGRTYYITASQTGSQVDCSGSGCGAYSRPHSESGLSWSDTDTNCGGGGVLNASTCQNKYFSAYGKRETSLKNIKECSNIKEIKSYVDPELIVEFKDTAGYTSSYDKTYTLSKMSTTEVDSIATCYDKNNKPVACKTSNVKTKYTNGGSIIGCNSLSSSTCTQNYQVSYPDNYGTGLYKNYEYLFTVETVPYQYTCKDGITRTETEISRDMKDKCVSSNKTGDNMLTSDPYYFVPVPYSAPSGTYSYTISFSNKAFGTKQKFYKLLTGNEDMDNLTSNANGTNNSFNKFILNYSSYFTSQTRLLYYGFYPIPYKYTIGGHIPMKTNFYTTINNTRPGSPNEFINSDCGKQYACGIYSGNYIYCSKDAITGQTINSSSSLNAANNMYNNLYKCFRQTGTVENNNNYVTKSEILKDYECTYEVEAFIEPVYRTISLADPFPGIYGTGRQSGDNWSVSDIQSKITFNRGVEEGNVYHLTPIYEFTLTPANIMRIRNYNASHEYSDFNLSCQISSTTGLTDGKRCISEFLKTGESSGYFTSPKGTCYNASTAKFESCLEVK